jgi:hypothetical protein
MDAYVILGCGSARAVRSRRQPGDACTDACPYVGPCPGRDGHGLVDVCRRRTDAGLCRPFLRRSYALPCAPDARGRGGRGSWPWLTRESGGTAMMPAGYDGGMGMGMGMRGPWAPAGGGRPAGAGPYGPGRRGPSPRPAGDAPHDAGSDSATDDAGPREPATAHGSGRAPARGAAVPRPGRPTAPTAAITVINIPPELLKIDKLNEFFAQFGTIVNLQVRACVCVCVCCFFVYDCLRRCVRVCTFLSLWVGSFRVAEARTGLVWAE